MTRKSEYEQPDIEFQLRERERFLRTLITNLPGAVYRSKTDAEFTKEFVSDGCLDLTGFQAAELNGVNAVTSWNELIHPQDRERIFGEMRRFVEDERRIENKQFQIHYRLVARDGSVKHVHERFRFVHDSLGAISALEGFITDITEKDRAEMNLVFLAEISQILVNVRNIDEMMRTVGAKIGTFLNLSNCSFAKIREAADEAVITHEWHRTDAPDLRGVYRISDLVTDKFLNAVRAGEMFVVRDTQTDSRTDTARYTALQIGSFVSVPLIRKGNWKFLLVVYDSKARDWRTEEIKLIRELTERIWTRLERARAETKLRESENRYKLLAENMHDLVCLQDLDGKYLYVSPSSELLLGYPPEELVGVSPFDNLFHPEDIEIIRDAAYARLLSGKISGIIIEHRMRDKKGEYCWFETMAQVVAAPNGEILQLQTVSRDITKRKETEVEREKTQKELAQLFLSEQEARREADIALIKAEHASRAKDEFLQMVSHEFRTPLTTIKTLVRVLQRNGKSETERQKHLETIASECDRQVDMILNLLDVSRLDEGDVDLKHEPVDINRVLTSCDKIERPAADSRRQVFIVERDESLPPVRGDEKAIRRALCTIIENAVKYTPEGGIISVRAQLVEHLKTGADKMQADKKIIAEIFGDLPAQMNFSVGREKSGAEIAVIICDSGRGILPEDIPRIFQKFYRGAKPNADSATDGTPDDAAGKAETPGVGLGLYLAKRLINGLGGRIAVNSEVGRGSCFTVFLPVWNEELNEKDTIDEYEFDEKYPEEKTSRG